MAGDGIRAVAVGSICKSIAASLGRLDCRQSSPVACTVMEFSVVRRCC